MASFRPTTNHCNYYCSSLDIEGGHLNSCVGFFRGNVVFVKRIHKKNIDLSREIRKELIHVRWPLLFVGYDYICVNLYRFVRCVTKTSIHSLERRLRPITSAFLLFIVTEGTLRYVNFPCVPRVVMHVGRCEPHLMNQPVLKSFFLDRTSFKMKILTWTWCSLHLSSLISSK